jgi:hypothetical protein
MDISWCEIQVPLDPTGAPWLSDPRWQEMLCGILSTCDEKQRRHVTALLSLCLERGGQTKLAEVTGLHIDTIGRGRKELLGELPSSESGRVRKSGGGRKKIEEKNPLVEKTLLEIVEAHKAGNPDNLDVWTGRSLSKLQEALRKKGFGASKSTIRRLLKKTESRSLETASDSLDRPIQTATGNLSR